MSNTHQSLFGEVIHSYSRAQAIEDGALVDVTAEANAFGFIYPTAISASVFEIIRDIPEGSGRSTLGRLHDVLFTAHRAIKKARMGAGPRIALHLYLYAQLEELPELFIDLGSGDEGEPVLTIGFLMDFETATFLPHQCDSPSNALILNTQA